jgi:hypothetical protein
MKNFPGRGYTARRSLFLSVVEIQAIVFTRHSACAAKCVMLALEAKPPRIGYYGADLILSRF